MIVLHGRHNTNNTETEDDDNNVHNVNESKGHLKMCTSKLIIYFVILKSVVFI